MAIPTIPVYTGAVANPDGSQDQQEFTTNMFNQLSYEAELAPSLNDTVNEMNAVAGQVDTNAAIAQNSADAAQAAANFEGEFVVGVTSAEKGKSYSYDGEVWLCLQNTTTTPSQGSVEWKLSVGEQYVSTAQGDVLGGKLFKGSNGKTVENGDVVEAGTTHLRVLVSGKPTIVAIHPIASGVVSSLTEVGAIVGGISVKFSSTSYKTYPYLYSSTGGIEIDGLLYLGDRVSFDSMHEDFHTGTVFFKVVPSGTGTADGGKYIDLPSSGLQLEQNLPIDVNIANYGAKPGDISTTAINNAASYCRINDRKLTSDGNTYLVDGDGDINLIGCHVDLRARLDFGSNPGYILLGGNASTTINPKQVLYTVEATGRGFDTPCVIIKGAKDQHIEIDNCRSTLLYAENNDDDDFYSIAYNDFWFNKVDYLDLQGAPQGASAQAGWINENDFYTNRVLKLRVGSSDPDTYTHNNNRFHGGTFEGSEASIDFVRGSDNSMYDIRLENYTPDAISFSEFSRHNRIRVSWVSSQFKEPVFEDSYIDHGRGNIVFSTDDGAYSVNPLYVLNEFILFDNDASPTKCSVHGVGNWTGTTESDTPTGSFYISRSAGVFSQGSFRVVCRAQKVGVSTTRDSWILLDSYGVSTGGFRVRVFGYDKDGNLLTPQANDMYHQGAGFFAFGTAPSVNLTNTRIHINREDCAYVDIAVETGSVLTEFKGLSLSIRNPKVSTNTNGTKYNAAHYSHPCNPSSL